MVELLRKVHLLAGLSTAELSLVAEICSEKVAAADELVIDQESEGTELFIIAEGAIEVFVSNGSQEKQLVILLEGQLFGEMALVNQGYRSASGRAGQEGCKMLVINAERFNRLCAQHGQIGYKVMRNLAQDLSFKIRHQNMAQR